MKGIYHHHNRLKALTLSDVMVAFINQESTTDNTERLKSYLKCKVVETRDDIEHGEQIILLPDFAKEELGETELLQYHLNNKHSNLEFVKNYQSLLGGVESKLNKCIELHSQRMEEGQIALQQLSNKLEQAHQLVFVSRKPIKSMRIQIDSTYNKINKLVRIRSNLISTLHALSLWNKHNLSTILTIDQSTIHKHPNIAELLQKMQAILKQEGNIGKNTSPSINSNSNTVLNPPAIQLSLGRLADVVQQRMGTVISQVKQNMLNSVINYKDEPSYALVCEQYRQILPFLPQSHESYLFHPTLIVSPNVASIYSNCFNFGRKSSMSNSLINTSSTMTNAQIDALSPQKYISFFFRLFEMYSQYIKNWHRATTFHVNQEQNQSHCGTGTSGTETRGGTKTTGGTEISSSAVNACTQTMTLAPPKHYGDAWIRGRAELREKVLEKVGTLLKYSSKFDQLQDEPSLLISLLVGLAEFVDCSQQWLGSASLKSPQLSQSQLPLSHSPTSNLSSIGTVLWYKMTTSSSTFTKKNNSILKEVLVDYFDVAKQQSISLMSPTAQSIRENIMAKYQISPQSTSKISHLLNNCTNRAPEQQIQVELPPFTLPISLKLLEMGLEYINRDRLYPCTQFTNISMHFSFLLFIIYQVLVPTFIKDQFLEEDQGGTLSEGGRMWTESRHWKQRSLGLKDWIDGIGNQFEGLTVSMYVNVNKLYADSEKQEKEKEKEKEKIDKNEVILQKLNEKIIHLITELSILYSYFQKLLQSNIMQEKQMKQGKQGKQGKSNGGSNNVLPSLPFNALLCLLLRPYFCFVQKKYLSNVLPVFTSLKWDIKKLTIESIQIYKQYREKVIDTYQKYDLTPKKDKINGTPSLPQLKTTASSIPLMISECQSEYMWVFLMDLYSRVDKINDNGRQLIRLDYIELAKLIANQLPHTSTYASIYFQVYLNLCNQRNQAKLLERVQSIYREYPPICWKSPLLWIYADMSTRERKDYIAKIIEIYSK